MTAHSARGARTTAAWHATCGEGVRSQAAAPLGGLSEGCLQARRAPAVRAALLFGAPQAGKTALVHAVAAQAGAALFDLSPRATDGKYPGKAAALMVHMARAPCPV